ncbi:MAG: nucleoside deaminase [Candidatus Latescibacterota bacterium]|nr:MAG: nucleoside deaminase [Candidatus Latescibacterota bacterium]
MRRALEEAEAAFAEGEVPVGAVVVSGEGIIGQGHNRTEKTGRPFEHAELVALNDAVGGRDRWVLTESRLYVTIEPCVMCVGALLLARVPCVVFGAREPKTGACESVFALQNEPKLDHHMIVIGGVEADRCKELMQRFFESKRGGFGK